MAFETFIVCFSFAPRPPGLVTASLHRRFCDLMLSKLSLYPTIKGIALTLSPHPPSRVRSVLKLLLFQLTYGVMLTLSPVAQSCMAILLKLSPPVRICGISLASLYFIAHKWRACRNVPLSSQFMACFLKHFFVNAHTRRCSLSLSLFPPIGNALAETSHLPPPV